MGHEISYCGRCANRIGGADFEKGKAFRVSGKGICADCITPEERKQITPLPQTRAQSTTRIKVSKPSPGTSSKLPVARGTAAPPPSSKAPLYVGLSVGAIVLLGGGAWLMSGSKPPPPQQEIVHRPETPKPKPLPPELEPPKEDPQLRAAREALESARAKAKAAANDLEAQRAAWEEGARATALTPFFKEASAELQAVREKLAAAKPVEKPADQPPPPPPPPPPDPPKPPPPAEVGVNPALWTAAMSKATAGDLEGAAADLRKDPAGGAEADLLVQARFALQGSREEISKFGAGHPVSLTYHSGAGDLKKVEGTVIRALPTRLEIKQGEETVHVEIADISTGSVVALTRPSAVLHRRYALLCILEGDREAAEKLVGPAGFPARYWDYARDAASKLPKASPRELEARRLYQAAEKDYANPATLGDAIAKYKQLGESYADTAVVKAEQVRIKLRADAGKDYLLSAFVLKGSGGFGLVAVPRSEAAWTSKSDVDGPEAANNYVAAAFTALPGVSYKAWALIGACCTDTFTFYLQTTEGTDTNPKTRQKESTEPGSAMASLVKHNLKELARSHRSHVVKVPKSPVRWEWIPIPLPKYASAGPKKIHLISDQQGFSVGAVVVSSTRTAPPPDAELKEEAAKAKAAVIEEGRSIENPGEKAWKPIFDGKTVESLLRPKSRGWTVEDGKLTNVPGINDAAQSKDDFSDGEVRIRFETKSLDRIWFKLRQSGSNGYIVNVAGEQLKALDGKPHDLVFTARGETVTATLDGKPLSVVCDGVVSRGCLQFNAYGNRFHILSVDVRP